MRKFYLLSSFKKNLASKLYKALFIFFTVVLGLNANATNFIVTTTTDPAYTGVNLATGVITAGPGIGSISLRSALAAADNSAGPHTVTLAAGTYQVLNGTIFFGSVNNQDITINGITAATTIIDMQGVGVNQDRIFGVNVLTLGGTVGVKLSLNNITFSHGHLNSDPYGGGAIEFATTGNTSALTITSCIFSNNTIDNAAGTTGGAVNYSGSGTLTVTNTTFSGNTNANSDGGALYYFFNNLDPNNTGLMTVNNNTFTGNSATVAGGGSGGALGIALQGRNSVNQNFTGNITKNTFINNSAPGGFGGAVIVDNGDAAYIIHFNYNRFVGNTAAANPTSSAIGMNSASGGVDATNNWFGCNTDPQTTGACNRAAIVGSGGAGVLTTTPWLQLKTTASPNPICNTAAGLGNTTTVTTSFLNNSAGTAIPVANLSTLIGLAVTWGPTTLGSLSGQQATIQASGNATATFTSDGTGGTATVNTEVDNVPTNDAVAKASISVHTIPTVTTPANATSCVTGTALISSTITGNLAPTITWRRGIVALVNGVQPSGSTVSGQGTATLTITNVQPGDAGIDYNVVATNECGTATSGNATLFVNQVTGGIVGSDQTICSGGDPAAFTETAVSTGSGALTYQWQSGTGGCAGSFSNIPGATATTYDPPAGVVVTTYYRRVTTSTQNGTPCTANSNCITVTVNAVTGGTVAADQTVCSGGDPAAFTQSLASTGSGALTYQWQSGTGGCAGAFSDIVGAVGTTYDPPSGLLVTTYYRRVTTSNLLGVLCTANSNCITVSVNDVTSGSVGSDQTICLGGDPAPFTVTVPATGSGPLTYQWQSNTTGCAGIFSDIPGATSVIYDAPSGLLQTTYYRRIAKSTLNAVVCTANSNCITVTINNVTGGTVGSDQTLCSGGDPAAFTESVASTGGGALTYQWQSNTTACGAAFSSIPGATSLTYDPPSGLLQTTYYRRVTTSTLNGSPCTANSNCITVTVNNVTGGTIGSDQSICTPADPALLTQTLASSGGGALTYQWQSGTGGCAGSFSDIAGATATTYDPPAGLTQTTYYRRVTTSNLGGVLCTAISNCVTVTVNPTNTITLTSAAGTDNQTVLINTPITPITYSTTGATGATFAGLPPGVSGVWNANTVTISGSPTASGPFSYTVTLTGGCGVITANGTINVIVCSITLTSAAATTNQVVCNNSPITPITYNTTGATGATFSGLPTGVNGTWAASVVTISGTPSVSGTFNYTVTPTGGGCSGVVTATGTITVNPVPVGSASPQIICSGSASSVSLNSTVVGTTFTWTAAIQIVPTGGTITGFSNCAAACGTTIAQTLTNTGTGPGVVRYTVTPSFTNAGTTCTGATFTVDVTVNPVPNASVPANAIVCNGVSQVTGTYNFTSTNTPAGTTTFTWTNSNTAIGLAASGSGASLPTFTTTNATTGPISGTIIVTPHYTNAGGGPTCNGATQSFTITVNPTPNVTVPANSIVCNSTSLPAGTYNFTSTNTPAGTTTFTWTNSNTAIGLGASGSGASLPLFISTNAGLGPISGTIVVTPHYTNAGGGPTCDGSTQSFTITVNPTPNATVPANAIVCNSVSQTTGTYNFTSTNTPAGTTTFTWTNSNTAIGLAASGSGASLPTFTTTNATTGPISGTIIVTPHYTNAGGGPTCNGSTQSFTITVNPTPNASVPANSIVCNSVSLTTGTYNFTSTNTPAGTTTFTWTNSNTAIGLAASGSGASLPTFTSTNATAGPISGTIVVTPHYTNAGGGPTCDGSTQSFTITVNPTPNVSVPVNSIICNGTTQTTGTYNFTSTNTPAGTTTFTWTNSNTAIGLAASGSGASLPTFTSTNATLGPISGTIVVTPHYTNAGGGPTCDGATQTFTITVNPTPNVSVPLNSIICNSTTQVTGTYNFTSTNTPAGTTTFTWTNSNTSIGLGASGSGASLPTFTSTNASLGPISGTIIVTPHYTNAGGGPTCDGAAQSFTITVNPTPNASVPANTVICNNILQPAGTYNFTSTNTPAGTTTFTWTNSNTGIGLGASGSGATLPTFTSTNATTGPLTGTIVVTPHYQNAGGGPTCNGATQTFTITVNPTATVTPVPNQTVCNGQATAAVSFSSPTTGGTIVYNWTNNNTTTGLAASGTGDIASFIGTNATNAPVTSTVTVTPSYTSGGVTCVGTPSTFTITVNPTATVTPVPNQVVCNNSSTAAVIFSSPTTGGSIIYVWTNNNTTIGLGPNGLGNIPSFVATNATNAAVTATITVTPVYTNGGITCNGTPSTFTITVNPTPTVNAVANQVVCNNTSTAAVTFSGFVPGTVYNWTNNTTSIGLAASGTGNIASFTATNATNAPVTATITVTPTYTNAGVTCSGTPITFTITVNPTATVTPVANQTVCNNTATAAVTFSSPTTGGSIVYNWTNNTTSIGLAGSGSGNIASFTGTNATNAPVTATITVTPSYTNGGVTCVGTPMTFTITVNPTATVTPVASQIICNNTATAAVNFSSPTLGGSIVYNWTNNTTSIGLAASGSGNIASFTGTNATNAPVTATITVTPAYTNGGVTCNGTPLTFTITVNPTPNVIVPASATICNNTSVITGTYNFTTGSTPAASVTYTWTNSNTAIGLGASGSGASLPTFTSANATTGPISGTITVTPHFTNAGGGPTCDGPSQSFTITVNPTATVNAVANQVLCAGSSTAAVTFSSPTTGGSIVYNWTNNQPFIGLAASGTGNIPSFVTTNTAQVPLVATITVTPSYTNGGVTCVGTPMIFTITVNPVPTAIALPSATQTICSGTAITPINLSSSIPGTVFNWSRSNTASVTGIAASGTGATISGTLTNTTTTQQTVVFTITPTFTNGGVTCTGPPITVTVIVQAALTIVCPANITVNAVAGTCAAPVSFAATVTGTPAPTVTYSPASGSSFPVGTTTVNVTATNTCGTVTCSFTVTVVDVQIPVITTQPTNQSACIGNTAVFTVVAAPAASYQWQVSSSGAAFVNVAGATTATLTLTNVTAAMSNNFYRVLVTGPCGSVTTSAQAKLTVNPLPTLFLTTSIPPLLLPTQFLDITAVASPTGGSYVWRKDGTVIVGVTGTTLTGLTVVDAGVYTVTYTDLNGCVATASVTIGALPTLNFYVYPNPNTGQFHIQFYNAMNETVTVKVFNYIGGLIFQRTYGTGVPYSSIDVDLGDRLPHGTYLVILYNSLGQKVGERLIIVVKKT